VSPFPTTPGRVPADFNFYATFDVDSLCSYIPQDVSVLLPASSFARDNFPRPCLPVSVKNVAADSGGYVATRRWGEYRYSLDQYVNWLNTFRPMWVATMDYCCEPDLEVVTRERQEKTTANAWQAWENYRSAPFAWVPTIQGWLPADYRRHASELKPLIAEMQTAYADNPSWRVGVGTICRRSDVAAVQAILQEVRSVLPGVPLHLWGIKLDALRSLDLAQVVSTDSAVWHGKFESEVLRSRSALAGMSMRKYSVTVNLPAYMQKVYAAVAESRHLVESQQDERLLAQVRAVLHKAGGWTLDLSTRNLRTYAYAVRRNGTRREKHYLGLLSDAALWLEQTPVRLHEEQHQLTMTYEYSPTSHLGKTVWFPNGLIRVGLDQERI
jgi:hypothetical protein